MAASFKYKPLSPLVLDKSSSVDDLMASLLALPSKGRAYFILRNKCSFHLIKSLVFLLFRDHTFRLSHFNKYLEALSSKQSVYGDKIFSKIGVQDEIIFDLDQIRSLVFKANAKITFARGLSELEPKTPLELLKLFLFKDKVLSSNFILIEVTKN